MNLKKWNEIDITKSIQLDKCIIHTEEIEYDSVKGLFRVYPKLSLVGSLSFYEFLPQELEKLSEKEYAKLILNHFKQVLIELEKREEKK